MNQFPSSPIRDPKKFYLACSMERADFVKKILHPEQLSQDTTESWKNLKEKYPYASLVQLLNYKRQVTPTAQQKKELQLFFEHPLHFNFLTRNSSTKPINSEEIAKENVEETTDNIGELYKKEQEIDDKLEDGVSNMMPGIDMKTETIDAPEVTNDPVIPRGINVQVEESERDSTKKEDDVLELIKDLPEENPIKKHTEQNKKEVEEPDGTKSEEPQNLMVMMSFTDWLQYYKKKNENDAEDKKGRDAIRSAWQKEKLAEAMDDEEDVVPDDIFAKAMKSVSFGDGIVTEPLAELYVKQGKTEKAIELYKKLSLLNPEKRTYFAAKIKSLHI